MQDADPVTTMKTFFSKKAMHEEENARAHVDRNTATPRDALNHFSGIYGYTTAILLGSYATGKVTDRSDLDIYVEPMLESDYWGFCRDLSLRTRLVVDVLTQDDDAEFIRILKQEGKVLYG